MIPYLSAIGTLFGLAALSPAVAPIVGRLEFDDQASTAEENAKIIFNLVKDTLTTDEAMMVLGMSKPTILKKMKYEKVLPYSGQGGRHGYRIRKEDIAEYAKKNNITPQWAKVIDNTPIQDTSSASTIQIQKEYASFLEKIKQDPALLDDLIELTKTYQNQAKLKLEKLKLEEPEAQNSKEYKMKVILANMKINDYEAEILQYNLLKRSLSSQPDK